MADEQQGEEDGYFIWSTERNWPQGIAWWRPNHRGYTANLEEAGRYTREAAMQIYQGSHGDDLPIPEESAYEFSRLTVSRDSSIALKAIAQMVVSARFKL